MIVVLFGGDLEEDAMARAQYWSAEYKSIQGDRVFGRVRRTAFLRRLARSLGLAVTKVVDEAAIDAEWPGVGRAGRAMVNIDAVVGAVDPKTGVFNPLPALKLRWKGAWRRLWAEDDLDLLPALPVARGVDGWYLTDVPRGVVTLEVLRAKGAREVRISPRSADLIPEASVIAMENTGPAYSLVDCERDYDSLEHEECKAV